jgi:hypothetical protein
MTVGSCAASRADTIQAAAGIVVTIGNDVVALLHCEGITPLRAEITTATLQGEQERMIFQIMCCARDNVRMR